MARTMSATDDATEVFRGVLTGRRPVRAFNAETRRYEVVGAEPLRRVFGPYTTARAAKGVATGQAWGVIDPVVTAERAVISKWEPLA